MKPERKKEKKRKQTQYKDQPRWFRKKKKRKLTEAELITSNNRKGKKNPHRLTYSDLTGRERKNLTAMRKCAGKRKLTEEELIPSNRCIKKKIHRLGDGDSTGKEEEFDSYEETYKGKKCKEDLIISNRSIKKKKKMETGTD